MSLSSLKLVGWIPPVIGSHTKVSKVDIVHTRALPSLQVKEKERPLLQEISNGTSRRELLLITAASISLLPLLLPASAEARSRNAAMRQKIMAKLEDIRRKAGLSKPKDEVEDTKSKL